jgi:Flp pilus assembly protein TadD
MTAATVEDHSVAALTFFRAGRWPEAQAACQRVLRRQPGDGAALHLLGLLAHRFGRPEEALGDG